MFVIATVMSFFGQLQDRRTEEKGATAVEYALIVALMAAAILIAFGLLGGEIEGAFTKVASSL